MRLLLFVLAILVAAPAVAQVGTLEPVDEAAADPSFVLFRARLLEAVAARDTAFVLAHLHPEAKVSFGAENGIEGFRRIWLDESGGADLWAALAAFLPFGSTYDTDPSALPTGADARATVPYWFGAWPDSLAQDAFELAAIVGERVRVRDAPSLSAEIVVTLTYDLVVLPFDPDNVYPTLYDPAIRGEWKRIIVNDNVDGYVAARYLGSPIDFRMGFEKTDGRWQITFFVAGD